MKAVIILIILLIINAIYEKIFYFIINANLNKYIYYPTCLVSNFTCDKVDNNHLKCQGYYLRKDDISGVANLLRLGLPFEKWMNDIIREYSDKNKISLDIGAHIGIHSVTMAKYAKKVLSFEPNTEVFQLLEMNTKHLKNVYPSNYAIGNSNETKNLVVDDINTRSYIEHFGKQPIKQIKLDDFKEIDIPVGFIKIDIEGGEINAFKGMYNLIKKSRPIIAYEDHTGDTTKYLRNVHQYKIYKINFCNYLAK